MSYSGPIFFFIQLKNLSLLFLLTPLTSVMGITERKQRQQQEVKDDIIHCSWQIVQQDGWNNLSIRKIAEAIEYSVPVVYKHFENKDAIVSHLVQQGFLQLGEEITAAIKRNSDPEAQIKQLATAYWQFAARHPLLYEAMFGLGIPSCESIQSSAAVQQVSDTMRALVRAIIQENKNKETDEHLKTRTLWSILHGIVALDLLSLQHRSDICPSAVLKDAIYGYVRSFTL